MNRLIANDLLPVYQTTDTGEKVVDARELCGFLNVRRDFTSWIKDRIEKYGFTENEDFVLTLTKTGERQNVTRHDYILKLDMAKEIAMVENNEQGRRARKYFIEVEKRFRDGPVPLANASTNEYDKVTRLLQMLRMNDREQLFNEETERTMRKQIAEMVMGAPLPTAQPQIEAPKRTDNRPQWVKDGFGAKRIGDMTGVTAVKVGVTARKLGLQTEEYGDWYDYMRGDKECRTFIYNSRGRDALVDALKVGAAK